MIEAVASLTVICPYPRFRPRNSHGASPKHTISRAGTAAALLPRPGILHRRVHQLRRQNPGQHPTEIRSGSEPSEDVTLSLLFNLCARAGKALPGLRGVSA